MLSNALQFMLPSWSCRTEECGRLTYEDVGELVIRDVGKLGTVVLGNDELQRKTRPIVSFWTGPGGLMGEVRGEGKLWVDVDRISNID